MRRSAASCIAANSPACHIFSFMSGHSHHGAHAHHLHAHHHAHGANERSVGLAALLTGGFMLAELAGGLLSGSLALLADAGHMLTDFASLALAWFGFRLARKPADWKRTYGFDRFSVLVAFVNGLALFIIAAWITLEAIDRLRHPVEVLGGMMFWVALGGLVVNVLAFWVLWRGDKKNLNIRAASLHVLGDLLGSVAAITASLVIVLTGWTPVDPLLSILVAVIILRSAWRVVSDSAHILLEASPVHIDVREIEKDLTAEVSGVADIHHVHAWSITEERPMITLHARLTPSADSDAVLAAIKARLATRFKIPHATVEIERETCVDEHQGC